MLNGDITGSLHLKKGGWRTPHPATQIANGRIWPLFFNLVAFLVRGTSEPSVSNDSSQSAYTFDGLIINICGFNLREWWCSSLAVEEGSMHFALHCNSLSHVTQSSVHWEMPAFLAREMLLAFQLKAGIPTFGPSSTVVKGSKSFMNNLCDKYGIPTVKYKTFKDASAAKVYILEQGGTNCYKI
ncbi:hypothetical protein NL676_009503 [Syzygium grande]|nr:hypothetical protein NL676_009503 [Syzygium grande]